MDKLTYVLSIAGHDPSAGAGLTSDLKTMENHGVYGLSVCTALTIQNDVDFVKCDWIPVEQILEQIEILFKRFEISVVKIGIVESLENLKLILLKLKVLNPNIKVVLDPILKASAGFDFHSNEVQNVWTDIWKQCFIVTPNFDEIQQFNSKADWKSNLKEINQFTHVYLKGGHRNDKLGWDEVYLKSGELISIAPKVNSVYQKHGSGCVLSTALASNLALGFDLKSACRNAKYYTEQFLNSHTSLLGVHLNIKNMISKLHYISQGKTPQEHLENIEKACLHGADWIQLRLKDLDEEIILNKAIKAREITSAHQVKLIINDYYKVAKQVEADGVHLGKTDTCPTMARKELLDWQIIGGTANTLEDCKSLVEKQVDYIGLGPFRFTTTKDNLSPILGLEGYTQILDNLNSNIPVIAIGGITLNDVVDVLKTKVYGVAVSGEITSDFNKISAFKEYLNTTKSLTI